MTKPEQIIIPAGAMINFADIEDDEPYIANEPIVAFPLGPEESGGIPVLIPSLDKERTFFFHQPEKTAEG